MGSISGSLNNADDLVNFLKMLQTTPNEIEAGTPIQKPRLFSNPSTGEMGWLRTDGNPDLAVTTKFDVVLIALIGKIKAAHSLDRLPNEEIQKNLLQLIPDVQNALKARITRYDVRNYRWFNCYYWRILRAQVMGLQTQLYMQIAGLMEKMKTLPIVNAPPAPPMGLKKKAAKPSAAASPQKEEQIEKPAPLVRPKPKLGVPFVVPTAADLGQGKLKKTGAALK